MQDEKPGLPENLGFPFRHHTITELMELWDMSRSSLFGKIKQFRHIIGPSLGKRYSAEQVIIMCFLWEPPEKYYQFIIWLELNGMKEHYFKKFNYTPPSATKE